MNHLIGKVVEVEANGILYTGKLVEISETETQLEAESGWIVINNENINAIREKQD